MRLAVIDEAIFVRHIDLRQRPTVQYLVLIDYAIEVKHIGGDLVDFHIAQRFRGSGGHGSADKIKHGAGIGPITAYGAQRSAF